MMPKTDDRVIECFLRYSRAFETLDPQAVLPFYHEPCLFISPEGVISLPTRSEVAAFFRDVMKNLGTQGYRTSEFEGLSAIPLSPNLAVVTGVGIWRRADGSELRRFGLTYTMRGAEAAWEIVVATVHDPDARRPGSQE
jgi:ketosteroid isomerase-like protein